MSQTLVAAQAAGTRRKTLDAECPGCAGSFDVTGEGHQEGAAPKGEGHEVHDLDLCLAAGLRRHGR
ncbi:MAG TPA: hypothetical protein VFP81_03585 [Propionibacteriaceae bacterium]|nr:hypothetical protein [Propionibacteriaceae bacterium]